MTAFRLSLIPFVLMLSACAPEVGSKKWCEQMEQKAKGDWSMNDAADYTKFCVFHQDPDKS